MRQLTLSLAPRRDEGLATVVAGPNAAVVAQVAAIAAAPAHPAPPGQQPPPVYLWGPAGSGKSRLLKALAHERQERGEAVAWFDADAPLPWQVDARHGLVLVDDVQRLDAGRQHAAFALFIDTGSLGLQWVAAGDRPPVDLPLRDDLRTRLGWGDVLALNLPDDASLREILRHEADARGLELKDEVLDYVLMRFTRDPAHLMTLMDRLDQFALSQHRRLTVPLLRSMFQDGDALTAEPAAEAFAEAEPPPEPGSAA